MTTSDVRTALLSIVATNPSYTHGGGKLDPGDWAYQYTLVPGAHAGDGVLSPTTLNNNGSDLLTVDDYLARRFPTGYTTAVAASTLPANAITPTVVHTSVDPAPSMWSAFQLTPTYNPLLPVTPSTPPANALAPPASTSVTTLPFGLSPLMLGAIAVGAFLLLRKKG